MYTFAVRGKFTTDGVFSDPILVTVTVAKVALAVADKASTMDSSLACLAFDIPVLDNDTFSSGSDPFVVSAVTVGTITIPTPSINGGVASINTEYGGKATITFTPTAGFTGDATFSYQFQGATGSISALSTVTGNVPVAAQGPRGPEVPLTFENPEAASTDGAFNTVSGMLFNVAALTLW